MVGSGIGRTDLPQVRQRRLQPRPLPEADDRQMGQPGPLLALVDSQTLQTALQILGEPGRLAAEIAQDQHPDAPGLAVALRHEADRARGSGGLEQCAEDRLELLHRTVPEEGQRDMQVVPRDRPARVDVLGLPFRQRVERPIGEAEAAEQARAFMTFDASREIHTDSSRVCCRRRRSRWRAVTVARRLMEFRSPGKTKSALREPSGPSACRKTRPTGFSSLPPPGPAMPVTATATSAPSRSRAPAAIAAAVSAETAPWRSSTGGGTPSSRALTSSAYATTAPTKASLEPGTEVSRSATMPPVHDSAVPSVSPRARQSSSTSSSIGRSSRLNR